MIDYFLHKVTCKGFCKVEKSDLLGAIKLYNSKEMSVLYCFLTVDQSL